MRVFDHKIDELLALKDFLPGPCGFSRMRKRRSVRSWGARYLGNANDPGHSRCPSKTNRPGRPLRRRCSGPRSNPFGCDPRLGSHCRLTQEIH